MTDQFGREDNSAKNMRSASTLQQLSEQELADLQHYILSLKIDLQHIPLLNDELVEEVVSPQSSLNRWLDLVERISADNQQNALNDELRNWDNEGGGVQSALKNQRCFAVSGLLIRPSPSLSSRREQTSSY